jgi:hypothetical protein
LLPDLFVSGPLLRDRARRDAGDATLFYTLNRTGFPTAEGNRQTEPYAGNAIFNAVDISAAAEVL